MKKFIQIVLYVSVTCFAFSQNNLHKHKQTSQLGSDIYADAVWRLLKDDSTGTPNSIPVHIFIHDANIIGNNAELISLNVFIKNATSNSFGSSIKFNNYSDSTFNTLFTARSQTDAVMDIQSFDQSLPVKSSSKTIVFTSHNCSWPSTCTFTDITHRLWYFTLNIPADKLTGFNDVIDIKVDFELSWQSDVSSTMRVFRSNSDIPSLPGWYRGDTHFHTSYTDNSVEMGLSLAASKEAAKAIGLDWTTTSDHSCDFDNYGSSKQDNWQRLGNEIASLNQADSSFIFIRGMEVSLNNSNTDVVHMLAYPNDSLPFSMPYLGDGNGDLTATSVSVDNVLATLQQCGGYAYAAHPFAANDKLSSTIDGGIWNVGDNTFLPNNTSIEGFDVVVCNNQSVASDIYSPLATQYLFKPQLKGGEIWNDRNSLTTTDDIQNPWNVENSSSITPFTAFDTTNSKWHYNRFLQGMEVSKFLLKKGLVVKNANPGITSYKFFFSAGTDAHGSFNYSNTELTYGIIGEINDNAVGKLSTLAYCPLGMGHNGKNVIKALRDGHIIMSDGPIITLGLNTNNDPGVDFISGDEALLNNTEYNQTSVQMKALSTPEFGALKTVKLILGTRKGEFAMNINMGVNQYSSNLSIPLSNLLQYFLSSDTIDADEYFYIRAELSTLRNYGTQSNLYKKTSEAFHSFSNPVWIRKPSVITSTDASEHIVFNARLYPNPFNSQTTLDFDLLKNSDVIISIIDISGKESIVFSEKNCREGNHTIDILSEQPNGFWIIKIKTNSEQKILKAVKTK